MLFEGRRASADTARMLVTILIVIGVGYAVGFRFQNGVVPAILMVALAVVFGLAICLAARRAVVGACGSRARI